MGKRSYDPEAAKQHVTEARQRIEQAVAQLHTQEGWRNYLRQQSLFHKYSWGNTLLIWSQMESATHLRGYQGWLELGRQVRKGEGCIRILAPKGFGARVTFEDPETGDQDVMTWQRFGTAAIFDITQTDPIEGKRSFEPVELGALMRRTEESGDQAEAEAYDDALWCWLIEQGYTLTPNAPAGTPENAAGCYIPRSKTIYVKPRENRCSQLSTTIHEAAHALTDRAAKDLDSYAAHEVLAESVAYVVCEWLGVESTEPSADYVAAYMAKDMAGFKKALRHIQTISHQLIEVLSGSAAALPQEELAA